MAFEDITRQLKATDEGLAKARELAARGDFNAAEQLLNKNLNFVVEFYGASSLKTCNVLLDLADVNYAQEKYASVITSLQQVLITNDKEALYSQEELLSIKFKFAKALEHGGNHQDACNFYQSLLNDASTTFGASSRFTRSVAESLNALTRRHSARIKNVEDAQEQASQFDTGKNLIVRYSRQSNADGSTASGAYSQQKSFQEIRNFYKDGDPSTTQSGGKTLARRLGPGLTLVAATLLCVGIMLSGILTDKTGITGGASTTADSASSARAALDISAGTLPPGSYCTVDGLKSLTIVKEGEAVLYSNGIEAKVPLEKCGSEVYLGEGASKKIFRTSRHGLVDDQNIILYKAGVPELETAKALRTMAANLNSYYQDNGRYPTSQAQLRSMDDRASFKNPLNQGISHPRLMQVIDRGSSSKMTLADYNYANQFTAQLVTDSGESGEPCGVEIYVCPMSDRGETVVLRAYDSNGRLLPSSHAGRCYALVLNSGQIHS
ncbi:hypothetical protein GC174_01650 [bacterium]|nr:hypothetical protein [bacterium]